MAASSRACTGCFLNRQRSPQSTVRPHQPLPGWPLQRVGLANRPLRVLERLCLVHGLLPLQFSWPMISAEQRSSLAAAPLQEPSSLRRAAPPLRPASVFSRSRWEPLALPRPHGTCVSRDVYVRIASKGVSSRQHPLRRFRARMVQRNRKQIDEKNVTLKRDDGSVVPV